jgi:hypothetical protein
MPREDLTLWLNSTPQDFAPVTTPQLNTPSSFNSGNLFEQLQGFKSLAIVGSGLVVGKKVFDKVTGGVGKYTGRNDLQKKIDRVRKNFGVVTEIGAGIAFGPVGIAVATVKISSDIIIERVEFEMQNDINIGEADFRQQRRGARIDESRSRL